MSAGRGAGCVLRPVRPVGELASRYLETFAKRREVPLMMGDR